jgi:hypothetical protein
MGVVDALVPLQAVRRPVVTAMRAVLAQVIE